MKPAKPTIIGKKENTYSKNEIYKGILNEFQDEIYLLDENLNISYVNTAAIRRCKNPTQPILEKNVLKFFPQFEEMAIMDRIQQTASLRKAADFEADWPDSNGMVKRYSFSVRPIQGRILIRACETSADRMPPSYLEQSGKLYEDLFNNLLNGVAYCRMVYRNGEAVDYIYLQVNKAFTELTGLTNVIGKRVTEVIPGIEKNDRQIIEILGRVASTSQPEIFDTYLESLQMWLKISAYCPEKDHFIAIFEVITERKEAEKKLKNQVEELQRWYQVSIDREQRIIELKQEVNQLLMNEGKPSRYTSIN